MNEAMKKVFGELQFGSEAADAKIPKTVTLKQPTSVKDPFFKDLKKDKPLSASTPDNKEKAVVATVADDFFKIAKTKDELRPANTIDDKEKAVFAKGTDPFIKNAKTKDEPRPAKTPDNKEKAVVATVADDFFKIAKTKD